MSRRRRLDRPDARTRRRPASTPTWSYVQNPNEPDRRHPDQPRRRLPDALATRTAASSPSRRAAPIRNTTNDWGLIGPARLGHRRCQADRRSPPTANTRPAALPISTIAISTSPTAPTTATPIAASVPSPKRSRLNGFAVRRAPRLAGRWLLFRSEKLQVVDNAKFGTQYGAFASCRIVANLSTRPPRAAQPGRAGLPVSRPASFTVNGAFGAAAPADPSPASTASVDAQRSRRQPLRDVYNQDSENYAFFTHNIYQGHRHG